MHLVMDRAAAIFPNLEIASVSRFHRKISQ